MEKSAELLERVAASEPIARKLAAIQRAEWPVRFSHAIQPAQPFLAAVIANANHRHPIWIICPTVHSQELFYESLLNWQPDALFLPEAELGAAENVLPDPEIAAERLALLMEIEGAEGVDVSRKMAETWKKLESAAWHTNSNLSNTWKVSDLI